MEWEDTTKITDIMNLRCIRHTELDDYAYITFSVQLNSNEWIHLHCPHNDDLENMVNISKNINVIRDLQFKYFLIYPHRELSNLNNLIDFFKFMGVKEIYCTTNEMDENDSHNLSIVRDCSDS